MTKKEMERKDNYCAIKFMMMGKGYLYLSEPLDLEDETIIALTWMGSEPAYVDSNGYQAGVGILCNDELPELRKALCNTIENEEQVPVSAYYDDEDPGYRYADDDEDDDEDEGRTEYVLEQPDGSQIYWDYQKAVEGFNIYCDHYEHAGWTRVCRRQARNAAVVDGVEVRAMCAVYAYGDLHKRIDLRVRMECD